MSDEQQSPRTISTAGLRSVGVGHASPPPAATDDVDDHQDDDERPPREAS